MDTYHKERSTTTPSIDGDIAKGVLTLKGKSLPENSRDFYQPFITWLKDFCESPAPTLVINFDIEYYNTSSSNIYNEMLKNFRELSETRDVVVNWYYDEDDYEMKEIGQDFVTMIGDFIVLKAKKPLGE